MGPMYRLYTCVTPFTDGTCRGSLDFIASPKMPRIEIGNQVEYGMLACSTCQAQYPVIAGIPILLAKPFAYLRENFSIIDRYLKYAGTPIPQVVKKHLFQVFLTMLRTPNEPVVQSRKGYEPHFLSCMLQRFLTYYQTYVADEWSEDFPLALPRPEQPDSLSGTLRAWLDAYAAEAKRGLDLGCNLGGYTFEMAGRQIESYGVDVSFEALHQAMLAARGRGYRFTAGDKHIHKPLEFHKAPCFTIGSAESLPFTDDSFDVVLSVNIVDILPQPQRMLTEIRRCLRPGGTVILTTPFMYFGEGTLALLDTYSGQLEQGLKQLCRSHGFTIAAEKDDIIWRLNEYARKIVLYRAYGLVLRAG